MADSHHPLPEVRRAGAGGWISGPCCQMAEAWSLRPGDAVLMPDLTVAEITHVLHATVRAPGGGHGSGRALWWKQRGGPACGVMVRRGGELLPVVAP